MQERSTKAAKTLGMFLYNGQVELQRPNCPPLDSGVPKLMSVVTEYCKKLLGDKNKSVSKILEIDLG
ncbi:hypothetical protein Bca52824_033617 [Brassica carinata]|uniref:Uncharacterized protein n=1 Tax=Brassica carinata TaxID=52824 RepID=A0A8X7V8P4_BRACI|nr:hypothetical protein Bca52824_033617 [Brassica carinata]